MNPRSAGEWGASVLTWFGMLGLTACFIVWAATPDHIVEPIFVTAFSGLLVAGQGRQALNELKSPPPPPLPPGAERAETAEES